MSWHIYAIIVVCAACAACAAAGAAFLLGRHLLRLADRRVLSFQYDLIAKYCAEIENIYAQMRGWRHDYHQHMQAITAHLALKQYDEASDYVYELNNGLKNVDTALKTGNTMIDAILNSKISLARSLGIEVNAKAAVPKNIDISPIDLCVIIGNLIDNAIEACAKIRPDLPRVIRLYIDIFEEQLYISVSNTSGGEIIKDGGRYSSTKGASRGFGLKRVDAVADKYGGWINRQHEEGVFATEVMLPL